MSFEEVSQKVVKLGKDTIEEIQKMNRVRQLNGKVSAEKKKINSLYLDMGKKLYNMYRHNPLEGFEAEIQAINEKFTMIDLLKDQVRSVKGIVLCPFCNTEMSAGEAYCSNCGSKLPGLHGEEAVLEGGAAPMVEEKTEAEARTESAETVNEPAAEAVGEAVSPETVMGQETTPSEAAEEAVGPETVPEMETVPAEAAEGAVSPETPMKEMDETVKEEEK